MYLRSTLTQTGDADEEEAGEEKDTEPEPEPSSAILCLLGEAFREEDTRPTAVPTTHAEKAEEEVRVYRASRPAGLQDNPLSWWRDNEKNYPLLARLAKRYLCVPGTSVASERVFSTAGDIVTAKRSCLTPAHVNELLFLQKNLN